MALTLSSNPRGARRIAVAVAVVAVHLALLVALLRQTAPSVVAEPAAIKLVAIAIPLPPPASAPAPRPAPRSSIRAPAPRAVIKATVANAAPAQPAPAVPDGPPIAVGAATGSGGATGGDGGTGNGGGGGGGIVRALWRSGAISNRDYPVAASAAGVGGVVTAHFDVGIDGRVSHCRIVGSSGSAMLDATTCKLIEARFRYQPARDATGQAIADVAGWRQDWWLQPRG